ncbi:response regulator [Anoxynatronum sibiricum]
MIRAIVVDDEWYNLEESSDFIDKTESFHVVGKYQNPLMALEEIEMTAPQVAFIDIDLPEMDGITLAEKLLETNAALIIVFITSYNQYAVQAFDINAIDYILKPIKAERFQRMVEKIKNEIGAQSQESATIFHIRVFGKLMVTIGDNPVKWQRTKAKELFAYLLMEQGHYIHKEKIIEDLWPEHDQEKALQILQTSVCKIRNLFSSIKKSVQLNYSDNSYCLWITEGVSDYFHVTQALSSFNRENTATYTAVEKAGILFAKGFLAEEGYLWATGKDQQLREDLLIALKEMMNAYSTRGCEEATVRVLKGITKLAPFDEDLNYRLMNIYQKTGNAVAAFNHYQWLERTLEEEYDATPSKRIKDLSVEE